MIIESKSIAIVPALLILFAGVTCVTRPSTIVPVGMITRPFAWTGAVTEAVNLSPTREVFEFRVWSIRMMRIVSGGSVHPPPLLDRWL
jgi:hypothetical protein